MLRFKFRAEDWFTRFVGLGGNDVMLPREGLRRANLPELPAELEDKPLPIIYGAHVSAASASAPPQPVPNIDRRSYFDDPPNSGEGQWLAGYGDHVSGATGPTSVTVDEADGGSLNLGDVPGNRYYVAVVAVDAQGRTATPVPLIPEESGYSKVITGNGKKITVSWSGATGAASYRVYLGHFYYRVIYQQVIVTTDTSCEFDAHPPNGTLAKPSNISTGASMSDGGFLWWYHVSAVLPDGETGLSAQWIFNSSGLNRPAYLKWTPVTGAIGYRVYVRNRPTLGTGFIWMYEVGNVTEFTDYHDWVGAVAITGPPQPSGLVPVEFVGKLPDLNGYQMNAFLVAGHAVKEIVSVYQNGVVVDPGNYGVTFFVPGKAGFEARFGTPYRDINGQRYTFIYVLGPQGDAAADGSQPITLMVRGIESNGDSTGDLIEDLSDQYRHFLKNYVTRNWKTGAWYTDSPTWGDSPIDVDVIDEDSFEDVKERWRSRVEGGCVGAFIVGRDENGSLSRASADTWLARLNLSLDVRATPSSRKAQYMVTPFFRNESDLEAASVYTDQHGIKGGSFSIKDDPDKVENQITVQFGLRMLHPEAKWSTQLHEDKDAQDAFGETKPSTLTLWAIRSPAVAYSIGQSRLRRRKFPVRTAEWIHDAEALVDDLGTLVKVTHFDGYGDRGWSEQPAIITRHEFDPEAMEVRLTVEDVGWMFSDAQSTIQVPPPPPVSTVSDMSMSAQQRQTFIALLTAAAPSASGDFEPDPEE